MNVSDRTSCASRWNPGSAYAGTGRLSTPGIPSCVNHPSPVPSGIRRLCSARLSGASSSQKVAATRWGPAESPKSRHMTQVSPSTTIGYEVRMDADDIRRKLEERRDEMRDRVEALAQPPELGAAQGFGKRIGDGTVEAIRRLTDIGVGMSLEARLPRRARRARVERALAKLDEGTSGRCGACGAQIPPARLEALPDSVLCVDCASAQRRAV